ncbi:MAG: glutamate racemase [bacterium]|nr:glutamate racemase [bacterium]
MSNAPIGIFDSGVGGLTVVKELIRQLPNESLIYFGDTARVPYGSKTIETIRRYAFESAQFLIAHQVKALVVACNSSTAAGLDHIQSQFKQPVIGVIEPGAKVAVATTRNNRIGVIGTKATIRSEAYPRIIQRINPAIKVYSVACPLLVPLVEEGWLTGPITESIIRAYLTPLLTQRVDTIVLGCTHYPLLKKSITTVVGKEVKLVDSASATAHKVKQVLSEANLTADRSLKPEYTFYVSDVVADFERIGKMFLGQQLAKAIKINVSDYIEKG